MSRQAKPQPHQKLWVVRYGTLTRLVWAATAELAERKVRTGRVDTLERLWDVLNAPVLLDGEMFVKEASAADIDEWNEAGGKQVEWTA